MPQDTHALAHTHELRQLNQAKISAQCESVTAATHRPSPVVDLLPSAAPSFRDVDLGDDAAAGPSVQPEASSAPLPRLSGGVDEL